MLLGLSLHSQGQINKDPDLNTVCIDQPIALTFDLEGFPTNAAWTATGGSLDDPTSYTPTVTYSVPGDYLIEVTITWWFFVTWDTYETTTITVVDHPEAPSLLDRTPDSDSCRSQDYYFTFVPGMGGVDCSDQFEYRSRPVGSGTNFGPWISFSEEDPIPSAGVKRIQVQASRGDCNADAGCVDADWVQVANFRVRNDITAPTFTAPADITIYSDNSCAYDASIGVTGDVTDEADNCNVDDPSFTDVVDNSDPCNIIITRTWSLEDIAGNPAADQVQIITVLDTISPTATAPADVVVGCSGDVPAADINAITDEADNCSATPLVAYVSDVSDGNSAPEIITRTYSITDDCGNSTLITQLITVNDVTGPVPTVDPLPDVTAECEVTTLTAPSATDNCGGLVTVTNNASLPINTQGTTTITWTYEDVNGNTTDQDQDVVIADVSGPVISECAPDSTRSADGLGQSTVPDLTGLVTATDNCDASLTITQSPAAGTTIGLGNTIVTITVADDAGNEAECTATVTVVDANGPVISDCPIDINTVADTSYCGVEVSWTEPTATDDLPGVIMTSTHSPGDNFTVGTTTVVYTATDVGGNMSFCSFDVIVADHADPVITGATDVCTPSLETYQVVDPGSHTFTWTVTEGTVSGADNLNTVDVNWAGAVQGQVNVIITSGTGCSVSNNMTVNKIETPAIGNIQSGASLNRIR